MDKFPPGDVCERSNITRITVQKFPESQKLFNITPDLPVTSPRVKLRSARLAKGHPITKAKPSNPVTVTHRLDLCSVCANTYFLQRMLIEPTLKKQGTS